MNALDLGPRYASIRELGRGGMGQVLLVRDAYLKKELALKLLHEAPADPAGLEQLKKEFALLPEIEHPSIARAYDFGYLGDLPYFTTEYVQGETLGADGSASRPELLMQLAQEIAAALSFLHVSGILHLDIKPSNIIVPAASERRGPVLIDFGLFRRGVPASAGTRLKGSLPYMAPEFFFSSSRDLEEEVKKGRFRRDLLHRIQVVSVRVPPLRERLEDLEGLVRFFLREGNRPVASLGPGVLKRLREMPWPGNVRELKNLIVRLRLEDSDRLSLETLERVTSAPRAPAGISSSLLETEDLAALRDRIEREYFLHHLHRLGGDMDALRRFLGVSLKYCYRRCQWLGIRLKEERRRARRQGED